MWVDIAVAALVLAYVGYRLGLTVRAIRADREGDSEGSQRLRERAFRLRFVFLGVSAVVIIAVAAIAAITK